jgi:hypothetical protein
MKARLFIASAFTALAAVPASAGVLYKSIGPNGVVQFSDTPPEQGAVVAQMQLADRNASATANRGAPIETSPALDDAVQRAGSQVDLAEHALAQARRTVWSEPDLLHVGSPHMSRTDRDRIAYYEKGVRLARLAMADVMRRKLRADAPMIAMAANTGWTPVNPSEARASNDWIAIRPADRR